MQLHLQNGGIMVISRLPFEIEDILCISEGAEEWNVDRGNSKSQTYKLVSDVYEVTEKSPDSNYATVMHLRIAGSCQPGGIFSKDA